MTASTLWAFAHPQREGLFTAQPVDVGAPLTVLLLQAAANATVLNTPLAHDVGGRLTPAQPTHPWTGRTCSAGWGNRDTLDVRLGEPDVVLEVVADTARDSAGRWRHPVRAHRVRTDLHPHDLPPS
ncbi:hypothetical protein [Kitasatospora griseola]|uniref:hypothetical protein n=1 Tax=Kitasatospora griseola TaxID=2064 RepID=UPI0037F296C7